MALQNEPARAERVMPPRIIGVLGVAGSGKTLVSRHLVEQHGYVRTRFAEPIKAMLRSIGLTDAQVDGDEKMQPLPAFGGATARSMMQTLGTEWGRRVVHTDIWVNLWLRDIAAISSPIVVDDVRFPNEVAAIRSLGGTMWRVYRPGLSTGDHASERMQRHIEEDELITNATTIPALFASVDYLIGRHLA
jgi:hypothetical protein